MRRTIFRPSSLGLRCVGPVRLGVLTLMLAASAGLAAGAPPPRAHADAAPAYTVTDLGTLPGGSGSEAYGINTNGQVVGASYASDGNHAFRTTATGGIDAASDLEDLPDSTFSAATGINTSGQVVGAVHIVGYDTHAFRTTATGGIDAASDLGTLPDDTFSEANGINTSGQVVGYSAADVVRHAFRTTATGGIDAASNLGTLPGGSSSEAYSINASGQVVGVANIVHGYYHAFRTTATGGIDAASDLGTLPGGSSSEAYSINASGQVVGAADIVHGYYHAYHAFRTTATGGIDAASDLGTLPGGSNSYATSINASGQVVGYFDASGGDHAFLYDDSATPHMRDLNSLIPSGSGVTLTNAKGINDLGQIAANGTINGQTHAFRLTPNSAYPAQLQLTGIEVTQGIQDLLNGVPLFADRPTYVRAHVQSLNGTVKGVTAQLIGTTPSGDPLPGSPLTPANRNGRIDVQQTPNRTYIDDSFLFQLPPSWLHGDVILRVEGVNKSLACNDIYDTGSGCAVEVSFKPAPKMKLHLLAMSWRDNKGVVHSPQPYDMGTAALQIESTFPVAPDSVPYNFRTDGTVRDTPPHTLNDFVDILNRLVWIRRYDGCLQTFGCNDYYMGILVDYAASGLQIGGVGDASNAVAGAYVLPSSFDNGYLDPPHELGHVTGRMHTVCRGDETGSDPGYPYQSMDGDTKVKGRISKVSSGGDALYGFDINYLVSHRRSIYSPRTCDLMSYGGSEGNWPSDYTYNHIKDALTARFGTERAQAQTALVRRTQTSDSADNTGVAVISGLISPTLGTGTISSLYDVTSTVASDVPATGTYTIQFQDSQGHALASYNFEPEVVEGHDNASMGAFNLALPWSAGATKVVLLRGDTILDARQAADRAPTVTIAYPNAGEHLSGTKATLRWSVDDPSGRPLTYMVLYSRDGGATWQPLAINWPSTSLDVDLSTLPGTDQGRVRVLATDGFSTASAQSMIFSVAKHAPQAAIYAPTRNELYVGHQMIMLRGNAFDWEDGALDDTKLSWNADGVGALGTGRTVPVDASTLPEGTDTITLTATDSDGNSSSVTTTVRISRDPVTLPATLAVAPSGLDFAANAGDGPTPDQALSVRNAGDGTLSWRVSPDQDWIRVSAASGTAPADIAVSANPVGLQPGRYAGTITVKPLDASQDSQVIPVTLDVEPPPNPGPGPGPTPTPEAPSSVLLTIGIASLAALWPRARRKHHSPRT